LRREGLLEAARIKTASGCQLFADNFPAHMERGAGLPDVPRIPYFPEMAIKTLANYDGIVLAGSPKPVAFFGYKGMASSLVSDSQTCIQIEGDDRNINSSLKNIADSLGAPASPDRSLLAQLSRPDLPDGPLTGVLVSTVLAALQPEGAIIVDESNTSIGRYYSQSAGTPPFSLLTLTGGSLGQGPPCSVGAAVACPDRPVINFQGDGGALYTVQALWTQAREGLNVTTLICSNRSYNILKVELNRAGMSSPGRNALKLIDISDIDWVKIGQGLGVPSVAVRTASELTHELRRALAEDGPHLIEMFL